MPVDDVQPKCFYDRGRQTIESSSWAAMTVGPYPPREKSDTRRGKVNLKAAVEMMPVLPSKSDAVIWRKDAACQAVAADLFFPIGRTGEAVSQIEAAKAVCETCPVQVACLQFALETNQEAGVWGGTSEDERARLRKNWLAGRRRQRMTA